jgi:MOSC domain-containing protein YiiM
VQQTGFTGFYFRVLQEGWIGIDPKISLEMPDPSEVSIAYANQMMYMDKENLAGIRKILAVEALSLSWRETLGKRIV